ncbi:MAG: hypothetical protein CMJ58_24960 [Planctomycetaceae bacterium]|nr:hypothetical protein [Planctomycetaceae bacterium]
MIRKFFTRLLLFSIAITGCLVLAAVVAAYLATQQPEFYTELRAQEFTLPQQKAAEASLRLQEQEVRRWSAKAAALQDAPDSDTMSVTITQSQLNAQLAAVKGNSRGDWQNPRIHIAQDSIEFGVEIVTPKVTCVLSAQLKPTVTPQRRLQLDLVAMRVGRLPLPIKTVLGWLPRDARLAEGDVELDLSGSSPRFLVKLADNDPKSPRVQSVTCAQGELTIEFLRPADAGGLAGGRDEARQVAANRQ